MFIKCAFIYLIGDGQSNESKEVTSWQRKSKKTAVFSFVLPSWSLIEHIFKQIDGQNCGHTRNYVVPFRSYWHTSSMFGFLYWHTFTKRPCLHLNSYWGTFICLSSGQSILHQRTSSSYFFPNWQYILSIYLVRFAICVFHFSWMTLLLLFAMTVAGGHLQVCPSQTSGMFISS